MWIAVFWCENIEFCVFWCQKIWCQLKMVLVSTKRQISRVRPRVRAGRAVVRAASGLEVGPRRGHRLLVSRYMWSRVKGDTKEWWIGSKKGGMLQLSEAWHWSPLFISTALHLPRSANTEQANRGLQRAIILIVKRERTQIIRISQNNFLFSRSQRNWQIFKKTFKCTCLYNIVNKTSFDKFALLLYKLSVKKARHLFDSTFIASLSFAKKTFGQNSKTRQQ